MTPLGRSLVAGEAPSIPKSRMSTVGKAGATPTHSPVIRRSSEVRVAPQPLDVIFSLDAPPPVAIAAHELLQTAVGALPSGVPKPSEEAFTREACLLCVHAFWYLSLIHI